MHMQVECIRTLEARYDALILCAGLGAVASYGFVSNLTYGTGLAVAWIAFVRQVGKSPLMAGQWKAFLAFYAGGASDILSVTFPALPCRHCSAIVQLPILSNVTIKRLS